MKHIVGFSGGIDSQACALWVRDRYPAEDILLLNTNAGRNEHALTDAHVREYSEKVFLVTTIPALLSDMWKTEGFAEKRGFDGTEELTFERMIQIKKRSPSRKAQFCTEILKLSPQRRWVNANVHDEIERYTGVRRDESEARVNTKEREWDDYFDCYVNHPLASWTKQQCFDYVLERGEPINPLYSLGYNRVGCAPCINSGKDDVRMWADRFPEQIDKIRGMEQRTGKTYFAPCVPGMYTNTIDQVVEWSRTDFGGKQFSIFKAEGQNLPSCSSKYGLCE